MAKDTQPHDRAKVPFDILTQGQEIHLRNKPATIRKYDGHVIAIKDRKKGILSGEVRYNGGNKDTYRLGKENRILFYSNLEKIFVNPND